MGSGSDEGLKDTRRKYVVPAKEEGKKNDTGKPPISLIPREFIEDTALAFQYGAGKYGRHNFRKGIEISRTLDAAMRHLMAFTDGEDIDPESGQSHLAHAAASIAMTVYNYKNHPKLDDRFKKPK